MVRRVFWIGVGFGVSSWLHYKLRKRVRQVVSQLGPEHVAVQTAERIRRFGEDVLDAVADGRTAMRQREAELRAQIALPRPEERPALRPGPRPD